MNRAEACASKHRNDCLGDHWHVDDDPVARLHAQLLQHAGKARRGILQLGIGHSRCVAGDRGVIDDGVLAATPGRDVPVDRVVAGVHLAVGIPAVEGRLRRIKRLGRHLVPFDGLCRFHPEGLNIGLRRCIKIAVTRHDGRPPAWSLSVMHSRRSSERINDSHKSVDGKSQRIAGPPPPIPSPPHSQTREKALGLPAGSWPCLLISISLTSAP